MKPDRLFDPNVPNRHQLISLREIASLNQFDYLIGFRIKVLEVFKRVYFAKTSMSFMPWRLATFTSLNPVIVVFAYKYICPGS